MTALQIERANQAEQGLAEALLSLLKAAYALEAKILGVDDFPPLGRTLPELFVKDSVFWVARVTAGESDELVGALELEPGLGRSADKIAALVVSPHCLRRGIGSRLLEHAIREAGAGDLWVTTGRDNAPALALYQKYGFSLRTTETRQGFELVHLERRAAIPPKSA